MIRKTLFSPKEPDDEWLLPQEEEEEFFLLAPRYYTREGLEDYFRQCQQDGNVPDLRGATLLKRDGNKEKIDWRAFQGAHLQAFDTTWDTLDLEKATFEQALLSISSFCGVNLNGSTFRQAKLQAAKFSQSWLQEIDATAADMRQAVFSECHLEQSHFFEAQLAHASFLEAQATGASFPNANMQHISARAANFQDTDLSYTDMRNADFEKANLRGANLSSAKLSNMNLIGTNIRLANITFANLQGIRLGENEEKAESALREVDLAPIRYRFIALLDALNNNTRVEAYRNQLAEGNLNQSCMQALGYLPTSKKPAFDSRSKEEAVFMFSNGMYPLPGEQAPGFTRTPVINILLDWLDYWFRYEKQ